MTTSKNNTVNENARTIAYVYPARELTARGITTEVQKAGIRDYCEKHGLDLLEIYEDVQSDLDHDRPEFCRGMEFILGCKAKRLVAYSTKAWAQSPEHVLSMLRDLTVKGKFYVSLEEELSFDGETINSRKANAAA